jgi:translocation and assembly module TamB
MRRIGRFLLRAAALLLGVPLLLIALVLAAGNTAPGRHLIEDLTARFTGGEVRLSGLEGRFPDRLHATRLELADPSGVYLAIDGVAVDWSPLRLMHGTFDLDRVTAQAADFLRLPAYPTASSGTSSATADSLPVRVELGSLVIDRLQVAPAVAGHAVVLAATGSGTLDTLTTGHVQLAIHRLDGGGQYDVDGTLDSQRLHATIKLAEPADGLLSGIAGLPALGAIDASAALDGPLSTVAIHLSISAGPLRASAEGSLDLLHDAADLTVAANAPAMAPRPDISWQDVSLNAHVQGPFTRPDASGQVRIDALHAVGAGVTQLSATLNGNAGEVHVQAALAGLALPGQDPALFAAAPVQLNASMRLDAADRPMTFTLHHPLIDAQGTARTAGALAADVAITLPDLAPVAAAGGTDLRGHTVLHLQVAQQDAATNIALSGTIGVTGGLAQVQALLGDAATLDLEASLSGHDARLTKLNVAGRNLTLSADGGLVNNTADLHWQLHLADLAALQPTLSGQFTGQGQVSGPEQNLAASATITGNIGARGIDSGPLTLHISARDLPSKPSGSLTATGALLGEPVNVAVVADRADGVAHLTIQHADWKSLHAEGALTVPAGATMPQGSLHLRMTRLGDVSPLLGRPLAGSVEATLDADARQAKLSLTAQGAGLPGTASLERLVLNATVADPETHPVLDATLAVDGAGAGALHSDARLRADARLAARGPLNALALTVAATSADLSGAPARLNAAATLDAPGRALTVASLEADWHDQTARLLQPLRLGFGSSVTVEHLRLGLRQAVLAVDGRVSPTLDLTASLRDLPAELAAVVNPALAANGTLAAEARLTGTPARPDGTLRLTATGLRLRNGPGAAMPAATLTANATLSGGTARVDTSLTAGASRLAVTGTAPLGAAGALDLRARGALDLALLDPILTAEGRRARGQLSLDATVGGTVAAPLVAGSIQLAHGEVQDFTLGVHVTDITATLRGDGDRFDLMQLVGHAGPGTLGGSGSIRLAPEAGQTGMPINLSFTADNARPIASDLLRATLDAHLSLTGALGGNMTAAGTLHVRQADVRVPDKLPGSVAVLPVRVVGGQPPAGTTGATPAPAVTRASAAAATRANRAAGTPPPPAATGTPEAGAAAPPARTPPESAQIALNVTLDAPQQVFVRGRGLEVELGGVVHIRGTSANPLPTGGLELRRGTLSVAGQTLAFTQGSISFAGAGLADPAINLVATSTSNNVTATLTVSGTARDPKITLSSVPDLPQDEILAQLLFHQSAASLGPFQLAEIAAALADLSGATSGLSDPLAGLRRTLGLDQLSVGSGSSGSPTLAAGRYLAPGVYLGAQQSASGSGSQATVQIDITKGLKLETTAGTQTSTATGAAQTGQGASVGLSYQFEY